MAELFFGDFYAITTDDYIDEQGDQRYQTVGMYEGALFLIVHLYVEIEAVEMPRILSERQTTMSKKDTFDAAELKQQLDHARALKDEDIDTSDPDAPVLSEEKWARARPFHEMFRTRKKYITLHIDADVLDFYQRQGDGYQTRMNEALRAQMNAELRQHT